MKKNGYTLIELLVVIAIMGLIAFFTINRVSHALVDNRDELYEDDIYSILESAKLYGNNNITELKEQNSIVITVQDLIDNQYLASDEEGNFNDVRTKGATLNNLQIAITYDKEKDSVNAKLAK